MNALLTVLPDVANGRSPAIAGALEWVGMENIHLPLQLNGVLTSAKAHVGVNLTDANAKGIHMSRLYLMLNKLGSQPLSSSLLRDLLDTALDSHYALSDEAFIELSFDFLVLRSSLRSSHTGWASYPCRLHASKKQEALSLLLSTDVTYSSTCPCSAALSRELNANAFLRDHSHSSHLQKEVVASWLRSDAGLAGTPHSQRSTAKVSINLSTAPHLVSQDELPYSALIQAVEESLGTAVQTAVKREDEQAFAALNAENLMFVEDAARRISNTLKCFPGATHYTLSVHHHESLHAHDAVARHSGLCGEAA